MKFLIFALFAIVCLLSQCDTKSKPTTPHAPAPEQVDTPHAPAPEQVDTPRASAQEVFGVACQNCTPTPVFVQYEPEPKLPIVPNLPAGAQDNTNTNLLTYLAIGILGLLGFVVKDDRESRRAHQTQLNDIALGVERIETKIDNSIKNTD